jgi:hypothetical protein
MEVTMANKVLINESIVWDLIQKKQTVDAMKSWMVENEFILRSTGLLKSIRRILYTDTKED